MSVQLFSREEETGLSCSCVTAFCRRSSCLARNAARSAGGTSSELPAGKVEDFRVFLKRSFSKVCFWNTALSASSLRSKDHCVNMRRWSSCLYSKSANWCRLMGRCQSLWSFLWLSGHRYFNRTTGRTVFFFLWYGRSHSKARSLHEKKL